MSWVLVQFLLWNYYTGTVLGENNVDVTIAYNMDELCGQSVDLAREGTLAVNVDFQGEYQYVPDNCSIYFQSGFWNESGWDSISLYFQEFYIRDDSCLVITASNYWTTELLGRYCRYDNLTDTGFNTTNNGILSIRYDKKYSIRDYEYDTMIEFVVTVFKEKDGNCSELACHNNRCVPNDLMCLGYNPCGDWSDCVLDDVITAAIIALTFLTMTMMITCIIIKCCCCKPSKRTNGVVLSTQPVTSRNNQELRNNMSYDESMEIFPDIWDDNSFHEAIVLEPLDEYNNHRTYQTDFYEKQFLREHYHHNTTQLVANNFDAACSAYAYEPFCSGRAETPPPSYEEAIAQQNLIGTSNLRHNNGRCTDINC